MVTVSPAFRSAFCAILSIVLAELTSAQQVAPFTADSYLVNPANYLGKEVTLAVAYVMPSTQARSDGMQAFVANTYNLNQFGGHILVVAPPQVAQRLAQQCGTQHVWNHSHVTLIHGTFQKDETKSDRYCVFVAK